MDEVRCLMEKRISQALFVAHIWIFLDIDFKIQDKYLSSFIMSGEEETKNNEAHC
jgi:hypothetical protein